MTSLVTSPEQAGLAGKPPTALGNKPNALTQLLRRLHFYAGVLVGPFLLIAAASGFFYALAPQAEKVLHRHELHAVSTAQVVPLDQQVNTAHKAFPKLTVSGVVPGTEGATTRVLFADPAQPSDSYRPTAFIDPATGKVRGKSVLYGSASAFPERTWLSEVHRRLHLGEPGRIYSELAASWLAPITVAGVYLWWRQRRSRALNSRSSRGRLLRRHSMLGLGMSVGFVFLSVTGLTWSTYAGGHVASLRQALSWTTPTVSAAPPGASMSMSAGAHAEHLGHATASSSTTHGGAAPTNVNIALLTVNAAAQQDGLQGPYEISPPSAAGESWVVKEVRRSYSAGPDAIAVDPGTGVVTDRVPFSSYPLAAKLTDWGIRLHMGFLFGLPNQLLLAALALGLIYIVLAGYRLWWKRRPTREAGFLQMGRAPLRGSLLLLFRTRPVATVLGTVCVAAVCWVVPLLGVSVVAFLGLDVLLGRLSRNERRPTLLHT